MSGRGRQGGGWLAGLIALLVLGALLGRALAYRLYPFPYPRWVRGAATRTGLDPRLVLAVMRTESGFRPWALSRDGARGLMQVTMPTATWIAAQDRLGAPSPARLQEPGYNIMLGSWYLGYLQHRFAGQLPAALAAYNAGPQRVQQWLAAGTWDGRAATVDAIPFPETRRFVRRVLGTYAIYRRLYPGQSRIQRGSVLRFPPTPAAAPR